MRNFTEKDFEGSGQYLVRTTEDFVPDAGFLSTIMVKVGYTNNDNHPYRTGRYALIAMSDGWILNGYFITKDEEGNKITDSSKWTRVDFADTPESKGKQKLIDYLNNPDNQEYRFATTEEVVRVVMYQTGYRTRELTNVSLINETRKKQNEKIN